MNPNKSRISLWPDSEILTEVKEYCHSNDITFTAFFELAAEKYMRNSTSHKDVVGARPHMHIDNDDFKSDSDEAIINLYRNWSALWNAKELRKQTTTKPRWTQKDDNIAKQFNGEDPRFIEIGIINTLAQKRPGSGTINSFKYYLPEILKQLPVCHAFVGKTGFKVMHKMNTARLRSWLRKPLPTAEDLLAKLEINP